VISKLFKTPSISFFLHVAYDASLPLAMRAAICSSIALGGVIEAKRMKGVPSAATRNFVKFHLIDSDEG
jgi:hypothetical protein